jgi:hypothetical protein
MPSKRRKNNEAIFLCPQADAGAAGHMKKVKYPGYGVKGGKIPRMRRG